MSGTKVQTNRIRRHSLDRPSFTPHPTSLRSATFSRKGRRTVQQ